MSGCFRTRGSVKPFISKGGPESRCGAVRSTRWARWQRQPSTLAVGSTRLMPSLVTSLCETANVGSLAGMLHRVADHADQPDCGCHRRIPAGIDDAIHLGGRNAVQIAQGEVVNRLMVSAEEIAARTVNRERARSGESRTRSKLSTTTERTR